MKNKITLTADPDPVIPEPGIYHNIPMEEYNRWDAFRKSHMSAALKSGEHLRHKIEHSKSTTSLVLGSLVDCMLLEPTEYIKRYAMRPSMYTKEVSKGRGANKVTETVEKPWNANSHTCQAIQKELESGGKIVVDQETIIKANVTGSAVLHHPLASEIVKRCKKQVSIVWHDPNTGILCKGRLDLYDPDKREIWDLKTSVDASPLEFTRLLTRFNYHAQAGAYCMGVKTLTGESHSFGLIVVETGEQTEVPQVIVYEFDTESLYAGYAKFNRALKNVAVWQQSGFTGYSQFVEPIGASNWEIERELTQWEGELEL